MQSSFACFQGTGLFGHYLDREALENIKQYSYKGTGYTCVERVLDLWWNAAVKNLVPEVSFVRRSACLLLKVEYFVSVAVFDLFLIVSFNFSFLTKSC